MGKSSSWRRSFEVSMCSERYAAERRFLFLKTQLPPTRSLISKQSNGTPLSLSAFAIETPLIPAPMMHALGSDAIAPAPDRLDRRRLGRDVSAVVNASELALSKGCWRSGRQAIQRE